MKSILIVDDQAGIRLLLKEIFIKDGYNVHLAANGIEALQIAQSTFLDCILLDMKMPGMDGIEILKRIRQQNTTMHAFMMTAYDNPDLFGEASALGVKKFFTKPFNIFDVKNDINQLFID